MDTETYSRRKLLCLARVAASNLGAASDEALLVAWDVATERADRYGWGPKTTAEVERIETEVNKRGLGE